MFSRQAPRAAGCQLSATLSIHCITAPAANNVDQSSAPSRVIVMMMFREVWSRAMTSPA